MASRAAYDGEAVSPTALANEVLDLARSQPAEALRLLDETLSADDHGLEGSNLSVALRADGLAARAIGDLSRSRLYLEDAVAAAEGVGDELRSVEANLTLAGNQFLAGDPSGAAARLEALNTDEPVLRARIRYQAGTILARVGETAAALSQFDAALGAVEREEDRRMTGMVLKNRAMLRVLTGDYVGANADINDAIDRFAELRMDIEVAYCIHNTGLISALSGDMPAAFASFTEAEDRIRRLAGSEWEIQVGHCQALLAVGLAAEAADMASAAADQLDLANFQIDRAEALALKAEAEAALGRTSAAEESAGLAVSILREQGREAFAAVADLTRLRIAADGDTTGEALRNAKVLAAAGMVDSALRARVLAAKREPEGGGAAALAALAPRARKAPFDVRLEHAAALADARWRSGDRSGAATAANSGARLLDSYQALIGLSDVRLSLRSAVADLHHVGMAAAWASGRNRRAFDWMERAAISASLVRHPEPVRDPELRGALTELSALGPSGDRRDQRRRIELERRVRTLARVNAPNVTPVPAQLDSVAEALGGRTMARFSIVEDRVVAMRFRDSRMRRFELGASEEVISLKRGLRNALTRAATTRHARDRGEALRLLNRLDEHLLVPLRITDESLVVVPAPPLADVPWSGLPSRLGLPTVVARSAAAWMDAGSVRQENGSTLVVDGPDLAQARAEAAAVAAAVSHALRSSPDQDVAATLQLMEDASAVHVVSHGELRSDNPLFSSLRLHGGNLFAYQIRRLERAPAVVVLSACHLGLGSGGSGMRMLGFTDAVLAAGSGSVIASTLPVPDTAVTVGLMADLHARMAAGERPAAALAAAQSDLANEVAPLYGAAFTCFGAG